MKKCPKCGENIPDNFYYHENCGWKGEKDAPFKNVQVKATEKVMTKDARISRLACIRSACILFSSYIQASKSIPDVRKIIEYADDFHKYVVSGY